MIKCDPIRGSVRDNFCDDVSDVTVDVKQLQGLVDRCERLQRINADLLTALRQIENRGVPVQREEHRMARAAIAKAKGDTPWPPP